MIGVVTKCLPLKKLTEPADNSADHGVGNLTEQTHGELHHQLCDPLQKNLLAPGNIHVLVDGEHASQTTLQFHRAQSGGRNEVAMFGRLLGNVYQQANNQPVEAKRAMKWMQPRFMDDVEDYSTSTIGGQEQKRPANHMRHLEMLVKSRDPQKFKIQQAHEDILANDIGDILDAVIPNFTSGMAKDKEMREKALRHVRRAIRRWTMDLGILATEAVDFTRLESSASSLGEDATADEKAKEQREKSLSSSSSSQSSND